MAEEDEINAVSTRLEAWVTANIWKNKEELGDCKRLVLRHLALGGKADSVVHTIKLSNDDHFEPSAAGAISNTFAKEAVSDATGLGTGIQRYALFAYFAKDPHVASARHPFMVAGAEDDEHNRNMEPANEKGLVHQLMRHNEINSKNSMVAMGYMFQTQQKQMARLSDAQDTMMEKYWDMIGLITEIQDVKEERAIRINESNANMEVKKQIGKKLEVLLPIVVNKITGKETFPEAISPATMSMSALMESMTDEQIKIMLKTMTSDQQILLMDIRDKISKAKMGNDRASESMADMIRERTKELVQQKLEKGGMTLRTNRHGQKVAVPISEAAPKPAVSVPAESSPSAEAPPTETTKTEVTPAVEAAEDSKPQQDK